MALQAWTAIAASQTDADSPLDEILFDSIRTNQTHLRQVLYGDGSGGFLSSVSPSTMRLIRKSSTRKKIGKVLPQ